MINWMVRIKNKNFWLTIIPAVALLITQVLEMFGIKMDFTNISNELIEIVKSVFIILAIIGIINDPTTDGVGDSKLAMTYKAPKKRLNE